VRTFSKNSFEVKKQIEPPSIISTNDQSGTGTKESEPNEPNEEEVNNKISSKLEPTIYHSFQHPNFVKTEKIRFDLKRKNSDKGDKNTEEKKMKVKVKVGGSKALKHNFQFY